jgi:hypothetical protein
MTHSLLNNEPISKLNFNFEYVINRATRPYALVFVTLRNIIFKSNPVVTAKRI